MHHSWSNLPVKDIDLFVSVHLQTHSDFQNQGWDPEVSNIWVKTEIATGLLIPNLYYLGTLTASLSLWFVLKTQRPHGTINMNMIYFMSFELL